MIDIIITYVDENDKEWKDNFNYWKDKEIKEGKQKEDNRQAFGEERIREWNTLKYWFRGVEKCCPWVNKVILVVQNEKQVPKWLNTDYEKLRVVYHKDFIPEELLPTFNAMTIGMHIPNIKDLSKYYIISDDDYFFLKPIAIDRFFKYGNPVHLDNKMEYKIYGGGYLTGTDNVFYKVLNNTLMFETLITGQKVKYGFYHLPTAESRDFNKSIYDKYQKEIIKCDSYSKFRNENNLCPNLYDDLLKIYNKATIGNPYRHCCYCNLNSDIDFSIYDNKDIVCFNDTERLDNFEITQKKLIEFLDNKFPNRSKFEKEE
jgi:hypothetical protein